MGVLVVRQTIATPSWVLQSFFSELLPFAVISAVCLGVEIVRGGG